MYEMKEIPIEKVKPMENIRTNPESVDMPQLMRSINQQGLLQPIGVWLGNDGEYILCWGHRRLIACGKLGWKKIPAVILDEPLSETDFLVKTTTENLIRTDISISELAYVCKKLYDSGLSINEIAIRLSVHPQRIKTAMRLVAKLPDEILDWFGWYDKPGNNKKNGKVPTSVGNEILKLRVKNSEIRELAKIARREELTILDIRLIGILLRSGSSFKEALETRKLYKEKCVTLAVRKKELVKILNKHKVSFLDLVKGIVKGDIPPQKELIF